ncbi:hypothetical protein [Bradyrhizobium sp. CB3481]|uniref:hypothetical protein n=1 Tax=Bradyrhizobium sp. CB3481 TaxID=3039158 RepID=UPI0024B122BD|nr:hypothetical protein [Bradyrhizobium sp. CB3481]WFU17264.1 hypothetical protein QA643_02565 [Bradyrhizobium sp. CB3481]
MPLKYYQAFELTAQDEAIARIDIHCQSLEDAKERAKQLVQDRPVELWEGPMRIARFEPLN